MSKTVKKLCANKMPTHKEAAKILKQLKSNPDVCEKCEIKPCTLAKYLYG